MRLSLLEIFKRASRKYPHVQFYLDSDHHQILVDGGIPNYTNLDIIRAEVLSFNRDHHFKSINPTYVGNPTSFRPIQNTVEKPPVFEKPASSWPIPGASAQDVSPLKVPSPVVKASKAISVAMPQRGRGRGGGRKPRGRPTVRSRRFRVANAALRPRKLPFKQVIPVSVLNGYFDHEFKIKELVPEMLNTYEEIRVINLHVVLLVKDISVTAGLYTAILLDQNGYGNALKSTAEWFKRVADMPGSIVHHAVRGFKLSWVPTEPDSRNYVKVVDTADIAKPIARVYMIGQDNTLVISGVLLVRGHVLCRGQYYDAAKVTTAMLRDLRLSELAEEEEGSVHSANSFDCV